MVVAITFQIQGEVHVIALPVLWKPPAFVWLPSKPAAVLSGDGAMPVCLSGWRLSEPSRGPEKRNTTSQRSDVSEGIHVQIEIAKHQNTNQLRKKIPDTNNKTRTYWSSSSLYIYLSRFYLTMMISILHYIKWSNRFLISWSRISATILTLTPESFQYFLATCHACQQLLTFFLPKRENYWIHFCLPEVFAVKQHSNRKVKHLWLNGLKQPHHSESPLSWPLLLWRHISHRRALPALYWGLILKYIRFSFLYVRLGTKIWCPFKGARDHSFGGLWHSHGCWSIT